MSDFWVKDLADRSEVNGKVRAKQLQVLVTKKVLGGQPGNGSVHGKCPAQGDRKRRVAGCTRKRGFSRLGVYNSFREGAQRSKILTNPSTEAATYPFGGRGKRLSWGSFREWGKTKKNLIVEYF